MFDIKGDKISLNTEDLAIPPFKEHYNNAKDKSLALKEIEYVSVPDMTNSATKRLLDNIILAFNINGVYNIDWFDTMARKTPAINAQSIDNLQTLYRW